MLSACVRPPYDPFKTSAREVRDRVRTIALAPLTVNPTIADRQAARAQIEPAATTRLQAGGFTVVAPDEVDRVWRRAADEVGGVYDPVTGEIDEERFKTVRAAVFRDLAAERSVDAVLYLRIAPVVIYLPGETVTYCGTTVAEKIYWPPSAPHPNQRATIAVVTCLNAGLVDVEGRELYGIRHGLETIETYVQQTRAVRPIAVRLQQPSRVAEAVEATVGPLADAAKGASR